jgi:hypothetical protein
MVGAPVFAAVLYIAIAVGAGLPPFGSGSSSRSTTPTTATRPASQPPVSSAVATGFDLCLVGHWTVQSATVPFTVSLTGQSVPITGGKGATVTFTADGTQTEDYGNSAPFQGTVNGQSLVVNLRGIGALRATANNGVLSIVSGSTAGITGTAALAGGVPTSFQGSSVGGTSFSYTCSANKLNATSPGETFALTRS